MIEYNKRKTKQKEKKSIEMNAKLENQLKI